MMPWSNMVISARVYLLKKAARYQLALLQWKGRNKN